ncbi:C-C motif chemokine 20-like [Acipenser oxyrinchus oxyrinchus]|uniref:C-C motif chemokine 20-like n=1 Tax=Acipenser oxyrinchus oxyrinchus TaxID=40147 RepID=A0AAD8DHB1_ACIOX|nr:C-C motif chemokine 20-like [Acipenser oxyrinchus oxyrinchus]
MAHISLTVTAVLLVLALSSFSESQCKSTGPCCLSYSPKPLPCRFIKDYTHQHAKGVCNIEATVLLTARGKKVCANPKAEWVVEAIQCVNNRKIWAAKH